MFSVNSATIHDLAQQDVGFEVMMTYIILARGVSIRSLRRISSYNAPLIVSKTGLEAVKVESALRWLVKQNIIAFQESGDVQDRVGKWVLQDGKQDIYLPAVLTDNKRQLPPIMRLHSPPVPGNQEPEYKVDDLVALMMLYMFQDMEKYGGIDPRAGLYRQWANVADNKHYQNQIINIIGSDAAIFEIGGATELVFEKFADYALSYVSDRDARRERFFNALWHLQHLGFVYEVSQIWDSDPNAVDGREALPLYTHYVHDQTARGQDPSLQKEIQRVAYRLGVTDSYNEFTELDYTNAESVRFRYVADKQVGGYPIGVYRLKYRHKSTEVSVNNDSESQRANDWLRELRELHLQQP